MEEGKMEYPHFVDTYETERIKTLGVLSIPAYILVDSLGICNPYPINFFCCK